MDISVFDNKILIINDNIKNDLLKLISNKLLNIKLITLSELKKKYFFDYDKKTIHYVSKKYNVIPDIAKIYIDNLYYEDNELKEGLINNNLLITNSIFKEYINNSEVVLFNLKYVDNFYNRVFENIKNKTIYNIEKKTSKKDLYECNNKYQEIEFVASKVCELIKNGIDINKIKLVNVKEDYYYIINKTFKEFNIPVNIPSTSSIIGTKIVRTFIDNYDSDINKTIDIVKEFIHNDKESSIYKKIINIVNRYSFIEDYNEVKEEIINDLTNTKIEKNKLKNAVSFSDLDSELLNDNYVFLIDYNEGIIPYYVNDEDYLSDKRKEELGIDTSVIKNKKTLNSLIDNIKMLDHLIITYPKYDKNERLYISSSYDEDLFNEKEIEIPFNNSSLYNLLKLVSLKDENKKYGVVSDELIKLHNHYKQMPYLDYDNKYKGIDKDKLYDYLDKKLTLSYTTLNTYNECAFKYYIDNVLRLNKFEDSFEMTIGNIFHKVLSKCFNSDFNFESEWNTTIERSNYEFTNTDKYFLCKLKDELELIIKTIKNQLNYTQLNKIMCEKEIIINVNEELHITFKGFIDKIMYNEFDGETIVAIVDYKTGNPFVSINNVKYGLDMQLPIYMYLIKNSNIVSNVRIGGLYLQKILSNSKDIDERIDSLKLQGYSNNDEEVLSKVDSSYKDSKVIKSLKMGNNGFYSYSKVISDDNINYLCDLVKEKIDDTSSKIINAKFDINPKVINGVNKGCMFCKYKDICYVKNEDYVNLEAVSNVFGGEQDE